MTRDKMLKLRVANGNGVSDICIKTYLSNLFIKLWEEKENFNTIRPFGFEEWEIPLYASLVRAGVVRGVLNSDDELEAVDSQRADKVIKGLVEYIFGVKPGYRKGG